MSGSSEQLGKVYRTQDTGVRPQHASMDEAAAYYADYVSFVRAMAPNAGKLLDIGCGGGWSTFRLAQNGYTSVGIDLAPKWEVQASDQCRLVRANAVQLPFRDESFDVVASYQTLEHTTDPARVLTEAIRVLRPGGTLCIIGPNLLSLGASIGALTKWVWLNRPARRIFLRDADLPRHPFGNTLPEVIVGLAGNAVRITRRAFTSKPRFEMREPDLRPPFHGDNDACFLCNPMDL
ncbi:MAG: class I SAM-dependent methyltransferase, partial [Pyrinomonadaceae bacterium]